MMNNMNLTPEKINQFLEITGKQLGEDPETLRSSLEKGNAEALLNSLDPKYRKKVNQVMSDPDQIQKIMQSEQVINLLGKIMGGSKQEQENRK